MRGVMLILFFTVSFVYVQAQKPIEWQFRAKKIADKTYEVHLTATVQSPWHVYSQTTPDGGPRPTKIIFNKNPLVVTTGKTKEVGKLMQKHEDVFGVDVKYFNGSVDFVQVVKLLNNASTSINGTIEYMVCNDEQCLPPATLNFSMKL